MVGQLDASGCKLVFCIGVSSAQAGFVDAGFAATVALVAAALAGALAADAAALTGSARVAAERACKPIKIRMKQKSRRLAVEAALKMAAIAVVFTWALIRLNAWI